MILRPGFLYSTLTIVLGVVTAVVVRVTASEAVVVVTQLMGFALFVVVVALVFDMPQVLAASTVPVLGAVLIEAGFSNDPSWIRSLVVGCLWFVIVEIGWEALDRRDGSQHTAASLARRVQEVATVVVLALAVGMVAALSISLAPSRSVLLQAVVLALVIGSFATLLRRVVVTPAEEQR